jgi:hypothetical protein
MEKTPFNSIRKNIMSISMFFFSPDGSEKSATYKAYFSWQKRATRGSSFYGLEK